MTKKSTSKVSPEASLVPLSLLLGLIFNVKTESEEKAVFEISHGETTLLYVLNGALFVNNKLVIEYQMIAFGSSGTKLEI
ncbi:MAG: redox-sensitive bicupin YhaK (pirin superfamily) [Arcticibacterium sp.]|jgi:redox-sensitive bicupin YhaK (pirin superfamily)